MKKILLILLFPIVALGQSETHNFTTYDTTVSLLACQFCAPDIWEVRITRPVSDTASRPAIIVMNGQGELGSVAAATNGLTVYGPHYWLNNGWDGSVVLGNGTHYPILITVGYTNNVYPTAPQYYAILSQLLQTYHIKKGSVYLGGLSQGAFSAGALIEYEATAGAETGMSMIKAMALFEGTPDPLPAPYSTWSRGYTAFTVWAKKYGGRFFYLEGNGADNFRDGWQIADTMNLVVPGSAYFSYENLGAGAHCCWNSMYDPKATNWTSVGTLGPNNAPSQVGQNCMGDYKAPSSIFQWMLRQGDTTLVGTQTSAPPVMVTPPIIVPPVVTPPVTPPVIVPKPIPVSPLDSFAATLDHVDSIQITTTDSLPVTIDTLKIPVGYQSRVEVTSMNSAPSTGDVGQCMIVYQTENSSGTPIERRYDIFPSCNESGILGKTAVVPAFPGAKVVIQIVGASKTTVNWTVYIHQLLGKL